MKRTEYSEFIEKIKCSDSFRAEMEKKLSAVPKEKIEYEDIVQGVERVPKFNSSRFGALAASLILIGGCAGLGMHGMNIIKETDSSTMESQEESSFPYSELMDMYKSQQVQGDIKWDEYNDSADEEFTAARETGTQPMIDSQTSALFDLFENTEWYPVDKNDMSDEKEIDNIKFVLHPDGYENFTGVYYIFQIYRNGDAYFIKYDTSDDSLSDHIVSEICYMFTEETYEKYKALHSTVADIKGDAGIDTDIDTDELDISFLFIGNINEYVSGTDKGRFVIDISDETRQAAADLISEVLNNYNYTEKSVEESIPFDLIVIGYDTNTEFSSVRNALITKDGRLLFTVDSSCYHEYVISPDFYDRMKNIIESNVETGNLHFETVDQETMSKFIDERIKSETVRSFRSDLIGSVTDSKDMTLSNIGTNININNIEKIKQKMKSVQWEKCPKMLQYVESSEFSAAINNWAWFDEENMEGYACFGNNGLLYNLTECYRPVNSEDAEEIYNMLCENDNLIPDDIEMFISLTNGFNFSNMTGTYTAEFRVPAEMSKTGESYYITSSGVAYVDNANGGMMTEGNGTETESNDERRYTYLRYPDGRVRYDEAHGEGEATAHYDGSEAVITGIDYIDLYKQIVRDLYFDDPSLLYNRLEKDESNTYEMDKKTNPDGTTAYTFRIKNKRTLDLVIDEQGRLIKYCMLNKDGETEMSFALDDTYEFDSADFSMPEVYKINQ